MKKKTVRRNTKFMEYFDTCNVEVFVDDYDSLEKAIKKFTKKVKEDGILEDCWEARVYEKPSDYKRRKKKEAKYNRKKNLTQDKY